MSITDKLFAKGKGVAVISDAEARTRATDTPAEPKTAPGKMLGYANEVVGLRREIEELKAAMASGTGVEIAIADLIEVPGRKRQLSVQEFATLKSNLEHNPLGQPISVRRLANGKYEIIAGHNRTQAYRELGRATILAVVLNFDDDETDRAAFYTNLTPELPAYAKYLGLKGRMERKNLTYEQLAEESGFSKTVVGALFSFAKLPTSALSVIEANPSAIGYHAAEDLSKLVGKVSDSAIEEAIQQVVANKIDQRDVVAFAKREATPQSSSGAKKHPDPIPIRHGKKIFCQMDRRGAKLITTFSTEEAALGAEKRIEALLKEIAQEQLSKVGDK